MKNIEQLRLTPTISNATGPTNARTFADQMSDMGVNVRTFLCDDGVPVQGDGSHDDTTGIQRAVNTIAGLRTTAKRGNILFPPGIYQTTAAITYELADGVFDIGFIGNPGAKLRGTFNDCLLKRSPNSPVGGVYRISCLEMENGGATGGGIQFHSIVGGKVECCAVSAYRGIETYNSQSVSVDSCSIGSGGLAGAVGIEAGNATTVIATDVSGTEIACRHSNAGLIWKGGRLEVNNYGFVIGQNPDGSVNGSTGVDISGVSMERNNNGVFVSSASGVIISAMPITGTVGTAKQVASASWSSGAGGKITVVSAISLALFGWTSGTRPIKLEVNNGGSGGNTNYNTGAFVTGTWIDDTHFSIVRASDPGAYGITDTFWSFKIQTGLKINDANMIVCAAINVSAGDCEIGGVDLSAASAKNCVMIGVNCAGGPSSWRMPGFSSPGPGGSRPSFEYIMCNQPRGLDTDAAGVVAGLVYSDLPGSGTFGVQTPLVDGAEYDIIDCNTSTFLATAGGGSSGASAFRRVRYNAQAAVWQVIG